MGRASPPIFGPCLLWPRSPISATAEHLFSSYLSYLLPSRIYPLRLQAGGHRKRANMGLVSGRQFVKRFALCYHTIVCPVCLSCLSATLVYCGQTVGQIKTKLGMLAGLGPGHIVLDGDPAPLPKRGRSPQFSAHICCGQMAGFVKMVLGMEVGLGPGDFLLDGDPIPPPKEGAKPPPQFSAHVHCGRTAGWIKVALGTEVGPGPGHIVLDGDPPAPLPKTGAEP